MSTVQTRVQDVLEKLGEVGGDGQNDEFEAAFSNLAHAYARENAPSLEQFEVGFEVLERSDDGKRAAGVLGYQVGEQLLFAPVFWLRGRIRGNELLYVQAEDLFVPLKENWINYILDRRTPEIGQNIARNPRRLGIRQPDLLRTARSPLKLASADLFSNLSGPETALGDIGMPPQGHDLQALAQRMLPENVNNLSDPALMQHKFDSADIDKFHAYSSDTDAESGNQTPDGLDVWGAAHMSPEIGEQATVPKFGARMCRYVVRRMKRAAKKCASDGSLLPDFIRYAGPPAFQEFVKMAQIAPSITQAAYDFHGQALLDALRDAAKQPTSTTHEKQAAVNRMLAHFRAPAAVQLFRRTDPVAKLAELDATEAEAVKDDGYAIRDLRSSDLHSRAFDPSGTVQLQNPTQTGLYDVLIQHGRIAKCLIGLRPNSPTGLDDECVIVFLDGDKPYAWRTADPLRIWTTQAYPAEDFAAFLDTLETVDNGLDVSDTRQCVVIGPRRDIAGPLRIGTILNDTADLTIYNCEYSGAVAVDRGASRVIRSLEGTLYVPASAKMLTVARYSTYSDDARLGKPSDLDAKGFAGFDKLSVARDRHEINIKSDRGSHTSSDVADATFYLMSRIGLSRKAADHLVSRSAHGPVRMRVKYADNPYLDEVKQFGPQYDLQEQFGTHQMTSGEAVPEHEQQTIFSPVDMPRAQRFPRIPVNYLDGSDDAYTTAQEAAQSGQKNVFDTTVLGTMLRNMRDDQLIDRFIPALARAMDASGRLLYQFYWHQEDFAERYGDKDMPELEDSLRNIFEGLGDIVLKLKQKTIDPFPDEQNLGTDLKDLAGAS